jgi:hypothetical protein
VYPVPSAHSHPPLLAVFPASRTRRRYKTGDIIGQGMQGRVFMSLNIENGTFMAVKEIRQENSPEAAEQVRHQEQGGEGRTRVRVGVWVYIAVIAVKPLYSYSCSLCHAL